VIKIKRTKRDRLEILYDLLSSCTGGEKITWLMAKSRLSYKPLSKYLKILTMKGYIATTKSNGEIIYKTTQKGENLIKKIYEVYSLSGLNFLSVIKNEH